MATQHRQHLSRLHIPPNLNAQQPMDVASMYSPALPTAIHQSYMSTFSLNTPSAMQTPMQASFFPHPPNAPSRPSHVGHRQYASIAQLAAVGIHPPTVPMTPLGQHQFPPHMMLGSQPPFPGQPFIPKSRRTPSLGGPPKAPLGGPGRKHSPLPPPTAAPAAVADKNKAKKVTVKIPVESESHRDPNSSLLPSLWSRTPLHPSLLRQYPDIEPPETVTAVPHPDDSSRNQLPPTVDVFLPGKGAWEEMKHRIIEEKLQKLGVERVGPPEILAPHTRAASISSPADPALLFYKLNKLQQSQAASLGSSLATSPQPPSLSVSPQLPPRFQNQNRHGHSMSLAQAPLHPSLYAPTSSFTSFGPHSVFGSDASFGSTGLPDNQGFSDTVFAPQGRAPIAVASLGLPSAPSRPDSRPDFARGFGLDIPEEEEPEEPVPVVDPEPLTFNKAEPPQDMDQALASEGRAKSAPIQEQEEDSTAVRTAVHTRHASRVSVALSLGSDNRRTGEVETAVDQDDVADDVEEEVEVHMPLRETEVDTDAIGEWTGSEDFRSNGDMSDDGSIGEWSNPSDEERERQERARRRLQRRRVGHGLEIPRRIPNFPRPPNAPFVALHAEDDMISNPSEEGDQGAGQDFVAQVGHVYEDPRVSASNSSGRASRPLPPLPHSRNDSGSFSYHDPAMAHSRGASEQFVYPPSRPDSSSRPHSSAAPNTGRRDSLNPFAKPFVFGSRPSGSWAPGSFGGSVATSSQPASSPGQPGHSRLASIGSNRALNAAAQEFKPMGFTFRPPIGVPALAFPAPITASEVSRPLPDLPNASTARASQGREKRQKLTESPEPEFHSELVTDSETDEDATRQSMNSFRFPANDNLPSPPKIRRSAPGSPKFKSPRQSSLNASAKPFTFSGYPNLPPISLPSVSASSQPLVSNSPEESYTRADYGDDGDSLSASDMSLPQLGEKKRAPIPLDFKHPVSTNMVPAGLFKNYVSTDAEDRVRPSVRSRLDTREMYEHRSQHSLDDLSVMAISNQSARSRFATDPDQPQAYSDTADPPSPTRAIVRRSSLPLLHSATNSMRSRESIAVPDLGRVEATPSKDYERRLEAILDAKMDNLRRELLDREGPTDGKFISAGTDDMVREAMTMFRTQLQESASRGLDDSHVDARGEMDFELIKNIVEQGHEDSRNMLQRDLSEILQRIEDSSAHNSNSSLQNLLPLIHDIRSTILRANAHVVERLDAVEATSHMQLSDVERSTLVYELLNALTPNLDALRSDPIDYESLTMRLTQAVKPHISQLIDLASDKRETAGLIVDSLVPVLRSLVPVAPSFDTDDLIAKLTANISRLVDPIDAHVIKEQVADLVVERMDSRLAVRDMAMNADGLVTRVSAVFKPVLDRVDGLAQSVDALGKGQEAVSSQTQGLSSIHKEVISLLGDLPTQMTAATETLSTSYKLTQQQEIEEAQRSQQLSQIETSVKSLVSSEEALITQNKELLALHQESITRLAVIPESLNATTELIQTVQSEILARLDSRKDSEELRKVMTSNADLQVQLAKARASHGQARVEKDILNERFRASDAERERLRAQVDELQSAAVTRAAGHAALASRMSEQEQAMQTALERLKISDVTAQAHQDRIAQLEKSNRELSLEALHWKAKVESLEMQVDCGVRDKNAVIQTLNLVQKDRDHLAAQQSHWDDLSRAGENIEALTKLIGHVDNEEVRELRRVRDRSKVLEGEHAALQKRYKEQESKMANIERASATARQSLASAQQRSADWEKKARDFEGELERVTTRLDQAEQTRVQLEADYSFAKLQLEEREAEHRLSQDRERKTMEEKAALEQRVAQLTSELQRAQRTSQPQTKPLQQNAKPDYWKHENHKNGNGISRSSSRASTAFGATTPRLNGRPISRPVSVVATSPPPPTSTWDSIHAPRNNVPTTPKARHPPNYRAMAASPTPSVVSLAPTHDGWYE